MPRTSGGVYTAPANTSAVSGQPISSAAFNSLESDIGNELTNSLDRLGRGGMQAALNMGGFQINGLADPTLNQDAATRNFVTNTANLFTNASLAQMAASTIKGNLSGGTTNASDIPLVTLQSAIIPAGVVDMFAGPAAPTGWLECNGALISRTTYAALFFAIGGFWNVGDGSTTFGIPDFRGIFARGWDHGLGIDAGRALGSQQLDQLQDHIHQMGSTNLGNFGSTGPFVNNSGSGTQWNSSIPTSGNHGAETRPRNAAIMFIIKT
jgi:phage-related tail fiber protein